jgi:hypothetical protein
VSRASTVAREGPARQERRDTRIIPGTWSASRRVIRRATEVPGTVTLTGLAIRRPNSGR